MTHDQLAYLILVLVAFVSFTSILLWATITANSRRSPDERAGPPRADQS